MNKITSFDIRHTGAYTVLSFKSDYVKKPIIVRFRRRWKPTKKDLANLGKEIALLESWAADQWDLSQRELHALYCEKAREGLRQIIAGMIHVKLVEVKCWKRALKLNERGENEYVTIREFTNESYKWVRR